MIIIETTTGPVMVNDHEVRGFQFDKKSGEVIVTFANDMPQRMVMKGLGMTSQFEDRTLTIKDVEDVRYVGEQSNETYRYEGSEVERLQAIVKQNISENTDLIARCNKQAFVIEEYAFFLRRVAPHQQWHKFMKEELELLDKKVREKLPKFDVHFGRNDDN